MGSQSAGRIIGISLVACTTVGVGAWQAWEYFTPRPVSDPSPRVEHKQGGRGGAPQTMTGEAPSGGGKPQAVEAEAAAAAAPAEPTQFVAVPASPESAKILEESKPLLQKAVAANAEVGQRTAGARNAMVDTATATLMKLLGINGTMQDAMGMPRDVPAGAKVETRGGGPGLEGLGALLKDASVDFSRAKVEYFPEGPGMGPPPGQGGGFNATMRMVSQMPGAEKKPQVEVRIPVKVKGSTGPGDDLEIGVMMEQEDSGETWRSAGFNLHIKKPEVLQKAMGSLPARAGRAAPAAKAEKEAEK